MSWAPSLRSALSFCLNSPVVSAIYWGANLRMFYNDAFAAILGTRHPAALGEPLADMLPEAWDVLGPQLAGVLASGEGFAVENQRLAWHRHGPAEEAFWTYSFTPVYGEADAIVAIFVTAVETTAMIRSQRAEAAQRARLAQMFHQAPGFVAMLRGPEHRIELVNAAYMSLVGERDVLGRTVAEALPDAVAQGYLDLLDEVYRSGTSYAANGAKYAVQTGPAKTARERIVDFVYQPVSGPDGATDGIFVQGIDVTERAQSERALGDREAFIRLLLNSTSEAFYSVDKTGTTTLCNNAFVTMLGFAAPEDAIGRKLHDVIHHSRPDGTHYPRAECPIYRAAASGQSARVSGEVFFRLDGTSFPVDYRAEPLIRDGVIEGAICTFVDSTDRRAAEVALRESQALLHTVAQAMPNHVWTARPDGVLDWFNSRAFDYTGLSESELTGEDWIQIVHPDDRAQAGARWGACVQNEQTYETEFRLRRHDGSYRWHIARAVPVRGAAGEVARWIGTNTDIEDQKTAAQALADQNETLERRVAESTAERDRVWRNAQDLMAVTDADGRILSFNDAWTSHLGWQSRDLLGVSFTNFTHPEDLADTLVAFAGLLQTPLTKSYAFRLRARNGAYKWFGWTGAFEDGRVYANGRHTTTEREQAEALAISQEALRQSQKMEAVGQLTGGIAHDFNNMLSIVIGSLDIAARRLRRGDTGVEKYLHNAHGGAQRAATLTQRLLAFSRQSPLSPSVLNLNALVANMSELLRRTLGEQVMLETVLAGGLWRTHADPNQLENAIVNLAVNARDAMAHGGKLTIETANAHLDDRYAAAEPGLLAGQYVMIAVSDGGVGMDAGTLKRVFDPFFTTKPVGKGTGLGLSMVYGFAKQSGGHVRIYSEPGRGTTVKIYLPRHFGSISDTATTARAPSLPTAAADAEIVLVVEDEEQVRAMSCEALRELGYTVYEASGGEEARRLFAQLGRVDIVFTDVVMAGMSGRQLADALRADDPTLKVLYTTGYTRNAVVHNGVLDEGVAFLPKPFSVEELAVKLRAVLDG